MKILNYRALLDGGTVVIETDEGEYRFDYRIKTKTKGALYHGKDLVFDSRQVQIKIINALKEYKNDFYQIMIDLFIEEKSKELGIEPDNYNEIDGNLITLALQGEFDVITHGCNCFCRMGAGIAVPMKNIFSADTFPLEDIKTKGNINKLGQIDWEYWIKDDVELIVVNSYTQYTYNRNNPLDYEALALCLRKINHRFKNKHIGLPKIGCGLAGGDWDRVKKIIQTELKDTKITIINFKE